LGVSGAGSAPWEDAVQRCSGVSITTFTLRESEQQLCSAAGGQTAAAFGRRFGGGLGLGQPGGKEDVRVRGQWSG
jgi:hypothetical protein